MKILIDANPVYTNQLTGIGYFTDELIKHIEKYCDVEGFAFNFMGKKKYKKDIYVQEQKILPGKIITIPRHLGIDLPFSLFFKKDTYDIVLGTNYLLPPTGNIKNVAVIHDMCFIDHPEWVQSRNAKILRGMLPKTLQRSEGVITISEFSASRIRDIYGYDKPILVIGIPPKQTMLSAQKPERLKHHPAEGFFLFISTIEPRKNLATLLDAFESLPADIQKNHQLVIAGKPGWDSESLNRLRSSNNQNIIYLEYVSETERNWLYRNTLSTIVPSFYEGFGMMTLESLNEGSPVITSDIPPQKEILGDSGVYFKPKDVKKLSSLMIKMTDAKYRQEVLSKQRKVLKNFSWDGTAKQIVSFLEGLK